MLFFLIISFVALGIYLQLLWLFYRGWKKLPELQTLNPEKLCSVSLIIAVRNEEENLPILFSCLMTQNYPNDLLEIIFADDNSEDQSQTLIRDFIKQRENTRMVISGSTGHGKKYALLQGVHEADGDLLVFTDADTRQGENWILSLVTAYISGKYVLIDAPVVIESNPGFMGRFQSLEFFSLLGITAGSFGIGNPLMVNGSNMAVDRKVYLQFQSSIREEISSGDDIFLLLSLKKIYKDRMVFLKSRDAVVVTRAVPGIKAFLRQRLRWTSKSKYYRDFLLLFTAFTVLVLNLSITTGLILSFTGVQYLLIVSVLLGIKATGDFFFLRPILLYFNSQNLLKLFGLSQIVYFLYISVTGLAGNFVSTSWKGRKIKK